MDYIQEQLFNNSKNILNYKYTTSQILDTLRNMNVLETKGMDFIFLKFFTY